MLLAVVTSPEPASAQQPGAVAGTLALRPVPPKKSASSSRSERCPRKAVVFLSGDLPAAAAADTAVSIVQEGGRFRPGALAVRTGTVVRFPNADPFYHNVFSYSGPRFDLGRYPPGESREVVFDQPGIVRAYCEIHEHMRAVVVVTDHGFHAVVGEDGTFSITGVPPGSYTLTAYHPDYGTVETPVSVSTGVTARITLELGG